MNRGILIGSLLFFAFTPNAGALPAPPGEKRAASPPAPQGREDLSGRPDRWLERQEELERRLEEVLDNQRKILEELGRIRTRIR